MVYKGDSVETLGFLCKHAVHRGTVGWTFVSDSVQAHDYIMKTPLGKKLREKGLCYVSVFFFALLVRCDSRSLYQCQQSLQCQQMIVI